MIKTNTFIVYNANTYEKITKLGINHIYDFCNEDEFYFSEDKSIILCGSYDLCNYLNSNSLRVFEGDILRVTIRDLRMGEYSENTYDGMVIYKDDKYMLQVENIGYINLEDKDLIVDFEFVNNYYEIQRKLYKIKELFDNYFVSNNNKFSIYNEENKIYISNGYIIFTYIIKEERLKFEILEGQINYKDEIQNMLIRSCIDYLRKEINKIWKNKE
jgi:hypothetical protein|nr:MAG TPA: hypothetical protein [Herelleviridae sp.]